eukprot:gene19716-34844_t
MRIAGMAASYGFAAAFRGGPARPARHLCTPWRSTALAATAPAGVDP